MSFDFIKDKSKNIYFIGIGGISMSGLAEILIKKGFHVSGSDIKASPITDKLRSLGAEIFIGQIKEHIDEDIDMIVYTAAISKDNPEFVRAKELNIPLMVRAEFLGQIMKGHKYNIAISGTHGKTTTTSMLSSISLKAELDPTILVGGELDLIDGNVRVGHSQYFITEACEYKESFLKFFPYIGVILNIDADHLDYYKDIYDIQNAFIKFAKLIPRDGYLVCCSDDDKMNKVISNVNCNIITYGLKTGDITAKNINYDEKGCASFDVYKYDKLLFSVNLNIPGRHNILNSLASIAVSLILNISNKYIIESLGNFKGAHRRFELKGEKDGITIIDDYAHHPTEIKATLSAAQNYPHKRICCVFQPHTFSRTLNLYDEFTKAFDNVDELILADIYAAREKDTHEVSSSMLAKSISSRGIDCKNFHNFDDIVSYLNSTLKDGDLLLTIGAGDVFKVGEMYLQK
ncbi:MAG: UDP-N-acetylmuramate--L-alanine ligase [Clostridium sp.]|uniref:UDP-N-acetylmuramate--L-alanine ligase n=1 Tax=Clostridium sp. TaxID=1506 RepID=UPI0025BE8761|nr:UDP-N-acetylmuramate--L-alanine ligase [Clostridium sp.]MCH3965608.1 UDP-N-acetylmuramate--L-alanine ligase [Clostridium sp.]MCI1717117.1 UDP-N-acetylmuramate--L-alanine ligase [Clostridium sp.]MCI1801478.1 UDP-N-acetylmuramate--L-alanine ligase [Clostridium sp.]MCI1815303.1 UDP-N-acetylmuramate--L-alanine ligase [Clostridium sp.]MCI1872227.1 UDP-N-acetylmuramate--L-alanine ligase [Clostridium sp.]